jgi:drug/metabolite transporter (DMT)-like permease
LDGTRPVAAAASVLGAMAIIGLIDNFIVIIAETHGLWQFHLFRTAMVLPMIWLIARFGRRRIRVVSWPALFLRSFFVSAAMVLYFGALAFMPIAEVAAGLFTSPIWVLLISVVFFRRSVGAIRTCAALAGFAGVVLVLRPDTGALSPWAVVPVLAGLLYAIGSILTRERCAGESSLALLAGNFIALALWSLLAIACLSVFPQAVPEGADGFILRFWAAADSAFLLWVLVQAVGSLAGVWLLIRGYQLADTSFVSVFEFSFLIFASVWAYLLRGAVPDPWTAAGIVLIIASGVTIAIRGR